MQPSRSQYSFNKIPVLIWAILCTALWSGLTDWHLLPSKLERLNPGYDIANLVKSSVGTIIFSVACITLGVFAARKMRLGDLSHSRTIRTGLAWLAIQFLIGHGLPSLIFLTPGGLHQLTPTYVILILSIGFVLGAGSLENTFPNMIVKARNKFKERLKGRNDKVIIGLSMSLLFVSLLYSTARISYASSSIYFSNAKLTAVTQHVQLFSDDTFAASIFPTAIQHTALIQILAIGLHVCFPARQPTFSELFSMRTQQ